MDTIKNPAANLSNLGQCIAYAEEVERKVREFEVTKKESTINSDFTLNRHTGIELGRPGLKLVGPALYQACHKLAGMDKRTVDYLKGKDYGHHLKAIIDEDVKKNGNGKMKVRVLQTETGHLGFGVVGPNYEEFPASTVFELIQDAAREVLPRGEGGPAEVQVGLRKKEGGYWSSKDEFKPDGYFGQTSITPWETQIAVNLGEFTGPRGDRYVYGILFRQKSDGTGSADVTGFCFRVVCENGIIESKLTQQFSIAHRGKDAFPRLQNAIRNGVIGIHAHAHQFEQQINALPDIKIENPLAALVALGEKDLGMRRIGSIDTQQILRQYEKEMGSTAEAIVNVITHIGTRDKVASARETAQELGGRLLRMTPGAWARAEARGVDILAARA